MKRTITLLLVLTLLAALCGCGGTDPNSAGPKTDPTDAPQPDDRYDPEPGTAEVHQLTTVIYPERTEYPDETNYNEKQMDAWFEEGRARRLLEVENQSGLDAFFAESARQYLSGTDGENRVYSPVNVYMALAMTAELTEGESRRQILDLLGADSLEALRAQAGAVWNKLYQNDGASVCTLGSSLWMNEDVSYRRAALEALAEYYYAVSFQGVMGDPAYDKSLQDWINEQTGGLLAEQASGLHMDPETVLALAATICFRSMWTDKFSKDATGTDVFHGAAGDTEAEYLHRLSSGTYYWGDKFSAVGERLESGATMWFLLPDEGVSPEELLSDPEAVAFLQGDAWAWENSKFLMVDLSLPKFDVSSDFDLTDGLKAMGVTDVFDPQRSDFTPLTELDGVCVSSASHAARVKIDEDGVEAAAYTVMMYAGGAMPPEEQVEFKADRPFLMALRDESGLPLFLGVVNRIG